eukprot:CAMPEP_0176137924 /NCGR_PEP_ID=MMETSP0120_2-20121206/70042_1 /TAXON_ID=160619 /ORGANISM="Kryptoperidinium foliaceum, Strain CCMP 1326" /LENGTH=96 /DNA_ID=CAMNT_0017473817 /DNA_START=6 /DNA_END=296 /DNA_ORIENTATION=-
MEQLQAEREAEEQRKKNRAAGKMAAASQASGPTSSKAKGNDDGSQVGKYLSGIAANSWAPTESSDKDDIGLSALPPPSSKAKKAPKATKFGDFSGW